MPIEIKELVIRAVVDDRATAGPDRAMVDPGHRLIEECVEQVLEILRSREER